MHLQAAAISIILSRMKADVEFHKNAFSTEVWLAMKAMVILSPGFEEMEAMAPVDVLRRAGIEAVTCALSENAVVCGSHDIPVVADMVLDEADAASFDCLVLPGGLRGVENMLACPELMALVGKFFNERKLIAAVCAAPLVLERAGVLACHRFVCHPVVRPKIVGESVPDAPYVLDGNLLTGLAAGHALPWAIAIAKKLLGSLPDGLLKGLCLPADCMDTKDWH